MKKYLRFLVLILVPFSSEAGMIIGGEQSYIVQKGDTLERIGAKLGVNWKDIARDNDIDITKLLRKGHELKVNTRRIVPKTIDNGIIINIPDRTLYFFENSSLKRSFPIGLGKIPQKGKRDWSTPLAPFRITGKEKNPTWHVPESIQKEMEMEGKPVLFIVPPGPENPLGRYALKTTIPGVLIHETIWPGSVYQFRSHGCIRVTPEHMEKFFNEVELNTSGELIYMPVKIAVSDKGRILLEVHRDIYGKIRDMKNEVRTLIEKLGVSDKVDWQKVDRIIKEKSGVVEDISL